MELNKLKQLVITMEECGELIRACSKVLRHGTVDDPKYLQNLTEEMADVMAMMTVLKKTYQIDGSNLEDLVQKRLTKMLQQGYA
jgi:NTP pyrophosphatase (non-canonical NTP hydrolase)|tara:strand:- start:2004 stop:2255 length:252 start_codon:yes stop_codon:yes gene_type:complete